MTLSGQRGFAQNEGDEGDEGGEGVEEKDSDGPRQAV